MQVKMWKLLFVILYSIFTATYGVGRISSQKCQEYSNAVNFQQASPVLLPVNTQNQVSGCGIVEVPLIVGGSRANLKEFPHMALIGFAPSIKKKMFWECGGSLISELFVLTAAHCMNSREKGPAQKVKLGMTDVTAGAQEELIAARIAHPQYKPPQKYNDIGLLKLVRAVRFSPYIRPACLNVNRQISRRKAIATGFGKTSYDSKGGSKYLMKVQLSLISNSVCQKSFSSQADKMSLPNGIVNSLLCAGEMRGGKDTCQGDSGGPLQTVLKRPYCMYSIIGVTSVGKMCGFAHSPALYSSVSSYIDWIERTVWNNHN